MSDFEVQITDKEGANLAHYEIEDTGQYTMEERRIYVVKDWVACETTRVSIDEPDYGQSVVLSVLKELIG